MKPYIIEMPAYRKRTDEYNQVNKLSGKILTGRNKDEIRKSALKELTMPEAKNVLAVYTLDEFIQSVSMGKDFGLITHVYGSENIRIITMFGSDGVSAVNQLEDEGYTMEQILEHDNRDIQEIDGISWEGSIITEEIFHSKEEAAAYLLALEQHDGYTENISETIEQ